jgi:rhamnulokinase
MIDLADILMPHEDIYQRTGVQFLFFNTLFQLLAEVQSGSPALKYAERLLFMPDLLTYWLSGEQINERTISSTSQLLTAGTADWDFDLIDAMGIPKQIFGKVTDPGAIVGSLLNSVAEETDCEGVRVVACGGHDTASAVAGVPAAMPKPLFLSSGTWSLIGRELPSALVSDETFRGGFSNEQGLNGTTRFLKNVAGMWLLQECRRQWDSQGIATDYESLIANASTASTATWIDPDHESFQKPCDMPAAIRAYAEQTGQSAPSSPAEFVSVILESLALKYRSVLGQMKNLMPDLPDTLHIVGGGCQNTLLNQMAADATGLRVMAGPVEATAAGNIVAQLIASGEIASIEEGRAIISSSFQPKVYEPAASSPWLDKALKYANAN